MTLSADRLRRVKADQLSGKEGQEAIAERKDVLEEREQEKEQEQQKEEEEEEQEEEDDEARQRVQEEERLQLTKLVYPVSSFDKVLSHVRKHGVPPSGSAAVATMMHLCVSPAHQDLVLLLRGSAQNWTTTT